jgi:predicted nucleic acid-binding protein
LAFIDTNVLLRHLLADHPEHSPRASALMLRIQRGDVHVTMSDTVVFETVFNLERQLRIPKDAIRDALLPIIDWPSVSLPRKERVRRAFDIYVAHNMPFADAYHAAITETLDPPDILSFDRHYRRVATITRIEP